MKETATVALSGECADEIFGGYPWYRDPEVRERAGFPWAQSTAWRSSFLTDGYRAVLDPEAYVSRRCEATCRASDVLPGQSKEERRMKEMVNLNFRWFMQTLLDRKDRMSMWSGLEVRVPFCDYRIAEYLYGVPWSFKDLEGMEKGLLRKAMEDFLPRRSCGGKKSPLPPKPTIPPIWRRSPDGSVPFWTRAAPPFSKSPTATPWRIFSPPSTPGPGTVS